MGFYMPLPSFENYNKSLFQKRVLFPIEFKRVYHILPFEHDLQKCSNYIEDLLSLYICIPVHEYWH